MTDSRTPDDVTRRSNADRDLVVLFAKAIRLLGDAGYPVAGNRLAAKAWWSLKDDDPVGAHRVSGVMHYLAKLPDEEVPIDRRRTTVPATANTGVT